MVTDLRALPCPLCGSRAVVVHRTRGPSRRLIATCMERECACRGDFIMWQARPAMAIRGVQTAVQNQGQIQGQNEGAGTKAAQSGGDVIESADKSSRHQSNKAIAGKEKAP